MRGYGCASCPLKQECDSSYRGSYCAAARAKVGVDFDPQTIGDKIRTMEPEQFAELLSQKFRDGQGKTECLEWLNTLINK